MDINNDETMDQEFLNLVFNALPIAYVRPVITDKGKSYAVCTADGTQLAVFPTQDAAFFAAKQHELEPTLIH
jgi:hypothetical protein